VSHHRLFGGESQSLNAPCSPKPRKGSSNDFPLVSPFMEWRNLRECLQHKNRQ
jgi:hypothetical protein